jgi:dipeptidyl aminopeptidase/acylaminoacyl peptidase
MAAYGQGTKIMDESVYEEWTRIDEEKLLPKGDYVVYSTERIKHDPSVIIHDISAQKDYAFQPVKDFETDFDGNFVFFLKTNTRDSIRHWKRMKKEEDDFPKDTLCVFNLSDKSVYKIPDVSKFHVPKKWSGHLSVIQEVAGDTLVDDSKRMLLMDLSSYTFDTFPNIEKLVMAEEKPYLYFTLNDTEEKTGQLLRMALAEKSLDTLLDFSGTSLQLSTSKDGETSAFIVNQDTTETTPVYPELFISKLSAPSAISIDELKPKLIGKDMRISPDYSPVLLDDSKRLFFGVSNLPIEQDTNLLEEDIVNVEVWSYTDQKLYTVQENDLEKTKKESYIYALDLIENKLHRLANSENPNVLFSDQNESNSCLVWSSEEYEKYMSWEGYTYRDAYLYDFKSGQRKKVLTKEPGSLSLSPQGRFAYWFNREEQVWKILNMETGEIVKLNNPEDKFGEEVHDIPTHPWPYGIAYWTENDDSLVINDRYDLWSFDPELSNSGRKLTEGRDAKIRFRYVDTDQENDFVKDGASIILKLFNEEDKQSGYMTFNSKRNLSKIHNIEDYRFSGWMEKSKVGDTYLFSRENFATFPDLLICQGKAFDSPKQISNLNPQQKDYAWGTMHLVNWNAPDGNKLDGMVVKPGGFDETKKYPVIINFYEKSANSLHRHRAPFPHRSTINYAYYANRGYVILNVDVHYDIGYPGKSAFNTVMRGVDFLKQFSWVDQSRIALQGHSWGGYQIADILTRTDVFKCAESGAPVVNMTSAYGGIRWGSGLSRMFQYERTQSRIGATLWENLDLYLENSPLFRMDKMSTPVLILHNDKDGAVPWYQGIEYFVALRRLGKPAWLLNYNDEPHWPVKLQNRLDFNKRMQQFFDHYLKGEAMPLWMKTGVPPIEKGINQRY